MSCVAQGASGASPAPRWSSRQRGRPAASAAAASGAGAPSAAPTTPLPLLAFFSEFRQQVARLEGVEELPTPQQFRSTVAGSPRLSLQSGACHADRLRVGQFLYANCASISKPRGRPWRPDRAGSISSSDAGSLSVLQAELLPSLFSFHPCLAFQVAAFDGGSSWMVAVDYLPMLPEEESFLDGAAGAAGNGSREAAPASASSKGSSASPPAEDSDGEGSGSERAMTAAEWQEQQGRRLAAVAGMYPRAAVPLPASLLRAGPAAGAAPARLLLSSAPLRDASPAARRASLHAAGLPAFRAALSVYLNGLVAAPADASPARVRAAAQAQASCCREAAWRPPLCAAHLLAALGREWMRKLQEHRLASSLQGLEEFLPSAEAGRAAAAQAGAAVKSSDFVYFDPALLMEQP